jgi:hypothetical protein
VSASTSSDQLSGLPVRTPFQEGSAITMATITNHTPNSKDGNWILVEPVSGLCNRLRVFVSALIVAECMGRRTRLLWRPSADCNCRFLDLFQPSSLFEVVPMWRTQVADWLRMSPFGNPVVRRALIISQNGLCERKYTMDLSSLEGSPVIFFQQCYSDFIPNHFSSEQYAEKVRFYLNKLVPTKQIASNLFPLPSPIIGVHIRRTDHQIAKETSRLEDFVTHMRECLQEQPDISFFLATDDPETESTLKAAFPKKIITFSKSGYRRSERATIREALVDLLLLSKCDKILGSYYSSFSDYASMFRRVELYKVGVGVWDGPASDIFQR